MKKLDEAAFIEEICRHLDASVAHLPLPVEENLNLSRQAALLQDAHTASLGTGGLSSAVDDCSDLPPDIEARLDQIRRSAVAEYERQARTISKTRSFSFGAWIKTQTDSFNSAARTGMLATACLLLAAISIFYVNSRPTGTLSLEEEIGLVATAEDIELYENLEFYLWLAENESLIL